MRPRVFSRFGFNEINELKKLFIDKGWDKFEEFESFFGNYCSMLENLNPKQTSLVLDLTKDFIWLRSRDYYTHLKNTLLKLQDFKQLDLSTIHIIPLISKTDRELQKIKSSTHVAYLCQNSELKYNEVFKDTNFIVHHKLEHLPKLSTLMKSNNPILLVDDFVGTGDTALEALEEVLEIRNYDNNTLYIASLVCQQTGKDALNQKGYEVLSANFRKKGISDKYQVDDVDDMISLMNEVENILEKDKKFNANFKFGYKSSEALVAMIRTPNNTFPIY